jgi:phosphonate transport system ATP-binding protein
VIRVQNLSMCYPGGVKALATIDLEFQPGKFTVLLGPSGAGKSTLLRCLNLLTTPSAGKITVEDARELKGNKSIREYRRKTGMIFQQHQLITRYTALDNVLMGRIGYYSAFRSLFPLPRKDKVFALACLERVGLIQKALERVDRLSGGEQQRVGIARALAQQPMQILADEPVASLDPRTAAHLLFLLQRICQDENITTIVSLHQVHLAKQFADRVIGLSEGHVVFDGSPANLSRDILNRIYSDTERKEILDDEGTPALGGFALSTLSAAPH